MPQTKLTKTKIDNFEFDPEGSSTQIVWDTRLPNFGVRIYESGRKSFVIRYRNEHGRKQYMTIGKYGIYTLNQARSEAMEKLVEADKGNDPANEKRQKRNAATMDDLAEAYIEKYAKPRKKTWKKDKLRLERHILPRWGNQAPAKIKHPDVDRLHRIIGKKEGKIYEANRILEIVSKMFNFAANHGYISRDKENPAKHLQRWPEQRRERRLERHEAPILADAINSEPEMKIRNLFWMYLYTGARRSEMLGVKKEDVDLQKPEITFRDTKNGSDHTLPLSEQAVEKAKELKENTDGPYLFPSKSARNHYKYPDRPWNRIRDRAGLEDLRIHDLRRTVGSWLTDLGYSEYIIKNILNHAVPDVTGVYARPSLDPLRQALQDYADQLHAAIQKRNSQK
jgi:integrase